MQVAVLCLAIAVQLAACGSTDANEEASVAVSPPQISYGEVDTEAEAEATFTITNSGDAALEGRIDIEAGSDHFSVSNTGSYEVAAGSNREVTVTFAPQEEAELSGAIQVTHNADNAASPARVTLEGTGIVDLADPPGRP